MGPQREPADTEVSKHVGSSCPVPGTAPGGREVPEDK